MVPFVRAIRKLVANSIRHHARDHLLFSELLYHTAQFYIASYKGFTYDPHQNGEMELLRRLSGNIGVAFDVGANVGEWSTLVRQVAPRASIHAFEIIPDVADELERRCHSFAKVNRFGLAKKAGNVDVIFSPAEPTRSRMIIDPRVDRDFQIKTCPVETGDMYCRREGVQNIDILKVDVEGAEQDVILGFKDTIEASKICVIQFEYNHSRLHSGFLLGDFYDLLGARFAIGRLSREGVVFKEYDILDEDF